MAVKIAINGFGRIGRCVLRAWIESGRDDVEIVAVNDLGPIETSAHLLKFDSVHGMLNVDVTVDGDHLIVGQHRILVTAERNPEDLPWADIDIT
ncbi:MAG: erythrose-4-phosphate dehydrogenase, partial [Rhodobacteraceae bacterium]|nr:erythrose-4-phosphate dehydrogenase [Paracoccaceae bacterium]